MRSPAFLLSAALHACAVVAALKWPAMPRGGGGGDSPSEAMAVFSFIEPDAAPPAEALVSADTEEFVPPPAEPSNEVSIISALVPATAPLERAVGGAGQISRAPVSRPGRGGGLRGGGGSFSPPRYDSCPAPAYPLAARSRKLEGTVLLSVLVDAAGRPEKIHVRRSGGSPILDEAAMRAVWAWHFVPAQSAGQPITARVEVPVRFRFRG